MVSLSRQAAVALVMIAFGAVLAIAVISLVGQDGETDQIPRIGDGRPDLSGIWQALNTANWNVEDHGVSPSPFPHLVGAYLAQPAGAGVVESGEIPYRQEALARRDLNFKTRLDVDPFKPELGDPEAKCFLPGVPRATYMPFPFQIIQAPDKILIAYEYRGAPRLIPLAEGKPLQDIDSWMGQSVGRWEDDTLVVEVSRFNGLAWLDRAGNYMSETARVVERYTPISRSHLMYEATIEDPAVFTRAWKISMPLYRRIDANAQLFEFRCIDSSEEYLYGKLRKRPSR